MGIATLNTFIRKLSLGDDKTRLRLLQMVLVSGCMMLRLLKHMQYNFFFFESLHN